MVQFCYLILDCLSVLQWMARNWTRVLKLEKVQIKKPAKAIIYILHCILLHFS